MSRPQSDPAALLRGVSVGALTAALAVAAHAAAGGIVLPGAAAVLLAVLSAGVGAVAGSTERAADPRVLIGLLVAGQAVGHLTLAAAGHSHTRDLSAAMLAAHLLAVVAGAALVAGAERLCRSLSTALRAATGPTPYLPATPARRAVYRAVQPLQSSLLIAASISLRGPPAIALR